MRGTRLVAASAAATLLLGACAFDPDATVETHDEAMDAIPASLSGSFAWEGRLVVDVAEADFGVIDEQDREELDWIASHFLAGAFADDGSWRLAVGEDDDAFVDVRIEAAELLHTDDPAPDTTLYLSVDDPMVVAELLGFWGLEGPDQVRAEITSTLDDGPVLDAVLAVLDGGWGGVTGPLEPDAMGLDDDDLAELRAYYRESAPDGQVSAELLDDAVTLHSFAATADGGTLAVLDVHPRAAMGALRGLLGDQGPWMLLYLFYADEVPETIEEVGRVAFDADGWLTEIAVDVPDLVEALGVGDDSVPEISDETTIETVLSFSRHGDLATVVDPEDAATVSWAELGEALELLEAARRDLRAEDTAAVELEEAQPDLAEEPEAHDTTAGSSAAVTSSGIPQDDEEALAAARQVVRAAASLEVHRHHHDVYAHDALSDEYGFEPLDGVTVTLAVLEDDHYCLEGTHQRRDEQPLVVMETDGAPLYAGGHLTCEELIHRRAR